MFKFVAAPSGSYSEHLIGTSFVKLCAIYCLLVLVGISSLSNPNTLKKWRSVSYPKLI